MLKQDRHQLAQTAALLAVRAVQMNLKQGSHVAADDALGLHSIATRLHRFDERNCNEDLGCRVCDGSGRASDVPGIALGDCRACAGKGHTLGRREASNEKKAQTIAAKYGMRVYFQGDCRGCPVFLIPNESGPQSEDDSRYNQWGHAVCHLG